MRRRGAQSIRVSGFLPSLRFPDILPPEVPSGPEEPTPVVPPGQGDALSLFQAGQGGRVPPAPEPGQKSPFSMHRCLQRERPEVGAVAGLPWGSSLGSPLLQEAKSRGGMVVSGTQASKQRKPLVQDRAAEPRPSSGPGRIQSRLLCPQTKPPFEIRALFQFPQPPD